MYLFSLEGEAVEDLSERTQLLRCVNEECVIGVREKIVVFGEKLAWNNWEEVVYTFEEKKWGRML